MTKKIRFYSVFCLAIALFFCVAQLGSTAADVRCAVLPQETSSAAGQSGRTSSSAADITVQDEGVVRPENLDEGLSLKSLKDIQGRRVTVRQPVMKVTNDHVARPENVPVLEDTYVLGDFDTRQVLDEKAKVTFEGDVGDPKSENPKYPMKGLENSSKESGAKQRYFSCFEKYMLLRQAYYFNTHAMDIVKEGHLVKHPAADDIYGKIPDDAPAVTMHIVTDPIYRSPMTTGLYLVPGEKATVKIRGLEAGKKLILYTHHQDTFGYKGYNENGKDFNTVEEYFDYWDARILEIAKRAEERGEEPVFTDLSYGLHGQWVWQNQKVPCMGTTFTIVGDGSEEMEVDIGSMYGGPLYMQPTDDSVDFEITGAVLTPHFVLGVTTVEDFEKYYRKAPGLIATMDVENGQLIGPADGMAAADDIEKLAYFWHSVFAIDISLNGRAYNYNMTMCYDIHVPAGEAVALNSNFCAQPTYWFGTCMNYEKLTTSGNWGTFHELGHVQAKAYDVNWGFAEGDGEVWNNTLILLIYSLLCNMDTRLTYVEHGEFVHPYTTVVRSQSITKTYTKDDVTYDIKDYRDINNGNGAHFDQLSMYATLLHSFGPEKFVDMFYTYKLNSAYCQNKRADFVYRIALVDRVNILDWVNENYFANIETGAFTASQLEFLRSLPTFYPIAYRWANGIDGNETARKYEVDGKHATVFDLSGDNISSPKPFTVLRVTDAQHGTASYDPETQKVTYTPPEKVTEYDSFDIIVSAYGGRQVTLNVRFKLLYRGVQTEIWDLGTRTESKIGTNPNIDQAAAYAEKNPATSTEIGSVAGKGDFDHPNRIEYFRMRFRFEAKEDGKHTFYLRADDAARVKLYKNQENANGSPDATMTSSGVYVFNDNAARKCELELKKGETVYVVAELVNWGGKGNLHIGLVGPKDTFEKFDDIKDIPLGSIINADVTDEELKEADAFQGWQPRFADSIKDVTMDRLAEKTDWKVLEAPNHEGTDAKENLIDGDENTIYHSHYSGGDKPKAPHVFVIDTNADSTFNFFEIYRRANYGGNDKLLRYALYGCKESEYQENMGGENTGGWTLLFEGAPANADAARQRITFPDREIRYFKLMVLENGGHTVIRELYAGMQTELNQTVRPNAYENRENCSGFTENSANGKLSAEQSGAVFEFSFLGSGFEIYSDIGYNFGSATVTINGQPAGRIDLCGKPLFNQCVFKSGELEMGPYTVRVVTDSDLPFNISFLNVVYGTPVDEEDYPALKKADGQTEDFGDEDVVRTFSREWRTYVKDYKELTHISFLDHIPEGYKDTYRRMDGYIRIYRGIEDSTRVAFVYPGKIVSPAECGSLFAGCEKVTGFDFTNFDTEGMRGASGMFNGCASLVTVDLSELKTDNVQSMGSMFANCVNLYSIDLSGFKLAENAIIRNIFGQCTSLYQITLPHNIAKETESLLPGIFHDETDNTYTYKVTSANSGHVLTLHDAHNYDGEVRELVEPTCTGEGLRGYRKCTVCQFPFDPDADFELVTEENERIPAKGHDPEWVLGRMPTCTDSGEGFQQVCSVCGEVLAVEDPMPPFGHYLSVDTSKGEGSGYEIRCNEDGTATITFYFVCSSFDFNFPDFENHPCGHTVAVPVTIHSIAHTDATCTTDASYTFAETVDRAMIEEILNPEGKVADTLTDFNSVRFDRVIVLEGSLGHKYGTPTFAWRDNNTAATATFVCGREGCPSEADGHTLVVEAEMTHLERVDATCEADAYTHYTASAQADGRGEIYTESRLSEEPGTKKGHNYSGTYQLTENGMHRQKCLNGCEQYGDPVQCAAQESWRQSEDGTKHYRMCVCGRRLGEGEHAFELRADWTGSDEKTAHVGSVSLVCPTCGAAESGEADVGRKDGCLDATCEREGYVIYVASVEHGGKRYSSESPTYAVGRLGHDYVPAADALAWTEAGRYSRATLRLVCGNCTEEEANHTREVILPAEITTSASAVCGGHSGGTVYTVDPAGESVLGTVRSAIGDNRFNEEAVKGLESLTFTLSDSLVGHVWKVVQGTLTWKLSDDKYEATLEETFRCERCNTTITVVFQGECKIVEATCEEAEQIIITVTEKSVDEVRQAAKTANPATAFYEDDTFEALPIRRQNVEGKQALSHDLEDVNEIPATCAHEGYTAGKRCSRCGYTEGITVIPAREHVRQAMTEREATCTMSGASGGVMCTLCNEILTPQSEIPALGHLSVFNGDGRAATCTEAGRTESVSCSRCHQVITESETIPAKGHTAHGNGDGYAATCTAEGRTESLTCSECGETVRGQEVIPAKGHTWEIVSGRAATATESGLTDGERCIECGEIRTPQTEIPPLGKSGPSVGLIVGVSVGGGVALLGGVGVFLFLRKRRRIG